MDSGATITPLIRVINNSVSPKEVPVRLDIGDHYSETRTRYFPPGREDTVAFPVWSAHLLGHHLVRCSTMLEGDEDPGNDTLSIVIEVRTWIDAEAVTLLAPTGIVDSGATVIPAALVRNNSGGERTFTVRFTITTGYEDSVLVTLRSGVDTTTIFRPWFADEVGTFAVFCSTNLEGDMDPANDTLLGQVVVATRRDVSARRIVAPIGSVDSGAVVTPEALVANHGTGPETFAVRLAIGTGYADTQYVAVSPQDSTLVSFRSWVAGPGGWQTVRCSTMLEGDEHPGNDTAEDSVLVLSRPDAAVTDLYLPRGWVDSGAVVVPFARICNYGLTPIVVPVMMRVGSDYFSTRHKYLDIGAKDTVMFEPWTAAIPGRHVVTCSTMLAGDERPDNDARHDSVFVVNRFDAATVAILTPYGTIDSGALVEPAVIAANYGTTPELVPVRLRIGEDYDELVIRRIRPGGEDTLHFPTWSAGPPGTVAVLCSTELAGDQDNSNDYLLRTVVLRVGNDAAALEILAPRGVADSGDVIIPVARIANYSTGPREIPVLMRIEGGYLRTRRKTLGPGESDTVAFPAWRAGPAGTLSVTCSTALHADEVEKNNSVRGSVFVNHELDVAVTEIIVPSGLVDSGRTITPKARVANLGPGPVDITVEMRIGTSYSSMRTKTIDSAVSDTVHFNPWTARPAGTHAVRCTSRLEGDRNPANDVLDGLVSVHWRDAAAVAILMPTGTLRAGDTVIPSALIRNAGTSTERIPAVFRIGPDYAWTAHSESLAPGDTALLNFPPWIVVPGSQVASCSTALTGDMHPPNDKVSTTVIGTDRSVLLFPDSTLIASPGAAVDYHVTCVNLGNAPDTIDITTHNTRPDWQMILLDSTGTTPLRDHNGNSLPDLGALAPGESSAFVCRVVVPLEELGTAVDSTRVRSTSGSDPLVWDEVLLRTAVAKIASIIIEPDRRGETPPGQAIRHRFTVSNLGNVPDYSDLILSSAKGNWTHDLLDEDGKQLPDRNSNGRPDVGPLDPLGGSREITLVVLPDTAARIGSADTSHVSAVSFADENIRDVAQAITVVAGTVTDIVLESEWQRTLDYGDTALLPMSVRTVGTVPVTVNLSSSDAASDWQVRFLRADGREPLRDTDHDGNPDLPDVPAGTPTGFVIAVTAPGDRGLTGNPDSLGPARVTIVAAVSGSPATADSALLTLTLAPPLEVHNYPNPAQLRTTFIFSLPVAGHANLRIYGRLGELVAEIAAPASFEAGVHRIEWLLRDRSGRRLAPGTYYYLLEFTDDEEETVRRIGRLAVRAGDER
ncbi:MAG TPA: hypothetical protein ENN51_02880 [candidate division WOR-3 bacterium]|uniref:CARDB domain-containing protein n=1 Tax=candidate division WOR-3 bacterium TaxID=2052148 RepID=A0A7V0XEL9_UNCW3|nr:hypothetical protein [candidate division WOR-3 bacterium]